MADLFELSIKEYRDLVSNEIKIQKIIHEFLLTAYRQKTKQNSLNIKTTCYAMVFVLNGSSYFSTGLKEKIEKSIGERKLDSTFLKGNYVQVAEKYWNVKNEQKEYHNILFGDPVTNEERRGNQAIYTGKASSRAMKKYIKNDILDYQISDLFIDINSKVDQSGLIDIRRKEQMHRELSYAKKLLESYNKLDQELDDSNKEFETENRIRGTYKGSDKETLILARRGQGRFRAEVMQINDHCPFTMIDDEDLLIASHIKPWKDSDDKEKVNPNNGFMFTPTYDKLFDKGLISFEDDGKLLVSDSLSADVIEILGLKPGKVVGDLKITDECKRFLAYHRKIVFKSNSSY